METNKSRLWMDRVNRIWTNKIGRRPYVRKDISLFNAYKWGGTVFLTPRTVFLCVGFYYVKGEYFMSKPIILTGDRFQQANYILDIMLVRWKIVVLLQGMQVNMNFLSFSWSTGYDRPCKGTGKDCWIRWKRSARLSRQDLIQLRQRFSFRVKSLNWQN